MSHDPSQYLDRPFACECGKTHEAGVRAILYADDAPARLAAAVAGDLGLRQAVLVADARTYPALGTAVEDALGAAGIETRRCLLVDPPQGDPVCDDRTRAELEPRLGSPPCLVAVGSGVINDLCKWIASDRGLPYVVAATAASMNGYASENIAPAVEGVKRVISGTVPAYIAAVPSVIEQAPPELTAAGLGDVIAKPVSMTDWEINHLVFNEYFCPLCAGLIRDLEPVYMGNPTGIRNRDPATVRALFDALVYSGVSMTLAGTSFPASGGEHLVSHVLDMTAMRDHVPHDYHGRQVGLGTLVAAAVYERLLAFESPRFAVHNAPTDAGYWRELTEIVEEEHAGKRRRAEQAVAFLSAGSNWDRVRELAGGQRRLGPSAIKQCLRDAGAAHRMEDIGCSRERFVAAVRHAHEIRERYTVIDLGRAAGILPDAIEEIVDEYLVN